MLSLSAASIGSTILFVPSFLINGPEIFNVYGGVFSVLSGAVALGQAIKLKRVDNKAFETRKTDEFIEYAELYNEYVEDIAKFFEELGFKGDFSSYVPFMRVLHNGNFSKDNSYKYFPSENSIDYFPELLGARVSTGECCCRHNVSLFTDIINEQGGIAACFPVITSDKTRVGRKESARHAVTGLVHDGKKMMFDPTVEIGDGADKAFSIFDDSCNSGLFSTTIDKELHHHLKSHVVYDSHIS